jgi:molybdopterin-guanine dinucleotide biosynthesis protein A
MGVDKAMLEFGGRPLVEIAVEKLRTFCAEVSIVGNRADLTGFAPVVTEKRVSQGPAAGVEAGLKACAQPWAFFTPVDVPFVPVELLRAWAEATIAEEPEFDGAAGKLMGSSLYTEFGREPVFSMLRPAVAGVFQERLDHGERRLDVILDAIPVDFGATAFVRRNAVRYAGTAGGSDIQRWFTNLNTPEDVLAASKA